MDLTVILVIVGFLVAVGVVVWLVMRKPKGAATVEAASSGPVRSLAYKSGLKIDVLEEGSGGGDARWGQTVSVHYTGWLTDGTKFDSSRDRGSPFSFKLGAGKVIMGWDEGIKGMKVGEKRKLTIPARLGYGNRPTGRIPAGSTLVFEVELLGLK